jgi:hypothetical protein
MPLPEVLPLNYKTPEGERSKGKPKLYLNPDNKASWQWHIFHKGLPLQYRLR